MSVFQGLWSHLVWLINDIWVLQSARWKVYLQPYWGLSHSAGRRSVLIDARGLQFPGLAHWCQHFSFVRQLSFFRLSSSSDLSYKVVLTLEIQFVGIFTCGDLYRKCFCDLLVFGGCCWCACHRFSCCIRTKIWTRFFPVLIHRFFGLKKQQQKTPVLCVVKSPESVVQIDFCKWKRRKPENLETSLNVVVASWWWCGWGWTLGHLFLCLDVFFFFYLENAADVLAADASLTFSSRWETHQDRPTVCPWCSGCWLALRWRTSLCMGLLRAVPLWGLVRLILLQRFVNKVNFFLSDFHIAQHPCQHHHRQQGGGWFCCSPEKNAKEMSGHENALKEEREKNINLKDRMNKPWCLVQRWSQCSQELHLFNRTSVICCSQAWLKQQAGKHHKLNSAT